MGFDAGRAVTSLDFDFSTVAVADEQSKQVLREARGTIPEPSQEALEGFTDRLREIALDPDMVDVIALGDNPAPEQVVAALGRVSQEKLERVMDETVTAVVQVCNGTPSEDQIRALPPRVRNAFVGWLSEQLVGPTQPTAASRPSPVAANGVGPGT